MFENIESIKKFLFEENIVHLEVRSINNNKVKSIVFTSEHIISNLENLINKDYNDEIISIKGVDLSSSFVEVFLAHKTLVFFAESIDLLPTNKNLENKYSFTITDNNNSNALASPDLDKYRDFVGEISTSLLDIGEKVAYFYQDENNFHSFVLKESSKYSKEKIKYSIIMVSRAYNILINNNRGIFV